jgi:hypothetical protein
MIYYGMIGFCLFFALTLLSYSQAAQAKADNGKIVGTWKVEVDAGDQIYDLSIVLKVTEDKLNGTVSESQGYLTDVPLANILFDGENLRFEFTSATPPDGLSRLVKAEFKVGPDKLEGTMSVPDLQAIVPATGAREKK